MTLGDMRANGVRSLEGGRFLMLNPQPAPPPLVSIPSASGIVVAALP
jgi:hypothetical protein